jgi:DNA-binding phage protein
MARRTRTGFGRFFDEQMSSPSFAKAYAASRVEVDAVDRIVRALDQARVAGKMTKADLARAIAAKPEVVRRLFTQSNPNPTLGTVVHLAQALGYSLELVRHRQKRTPVAKTTRSTRPQRATLRGTRDRYSSPRARTSA